MPAADRGSSNLDSTTLLITGIALIGLIALGFAIVGGRVGTGRYGGRVGGIRSMVDQSIGMSILRWLGGSASAGVPPPDLTDTQSSVAPIAQPPSSIGSPTPTRARIEVYGPPAAEAGSRDGRDPSSVTGPPLARQRVPKAAVVAAALVFVLGASIVALQPGGDRRGGILGIRHANGSTSPRADSSLATSADPAPTGPAGEPTPSERASQPGASDGASGTARAPHATPAQHRTARPTVAATAGPSSIPGPTARPSATSTATPAPTPAPTAEPTPEPTPTPQALPIASFSCSESGRSLACDGSSSSFSDAYTWDFGDGNTAEGSKASHTYDVAGTYAVKLTVTNAAGSDSKTIDYSVAP